MKKSLKTIIALLLATTTAGCATFHAPTQINRLESLVVYNKRSKKIERPVQEFIRPEETIQALEEVEIINYTQDPQENKIRSILNYVQNLPTIKDEKEFWQYPHETLQRRGGDCDDKSILLTSMLIQSGIEAKVALIEKQASILEKPFYDHINHICVKVKHNNQEYFLETLNKKPVMIPVEKAKDYKVIGEFDKDNIREYKYK